MLPMKQTQAMISTYTADVSGVCSALYELGGMCIMHDASGCNSTYHTHDEPRWYDSESLVFISGLSEMEAILGDDEKLVGDIVDAANQLQPRFVAIAGTPIPMMVGCDLQAIAAQVEARCGIPAFGFDTNGMHSYVSGAGMALAAYARRMTDPGAVRADVPTVNLLGATPLDFSVCGAVEQMRQLLEENGWQVQSTWAMGSSPEQLYGAGRAWVNLVISSVGLPAAEALHSRFGTPYVVGTPAGSRFNARILDQLRRSAETGGNAVAFSGFVPDMDAPGIIIGESVTARSLAAAIWLERGVQARVLCPLEQTAGILSAADAAPDGEQELQQMLASARWIVADPLYRPIAPRGAAFYDLPHEAFSGRIWRNQIKSFVYDLERREP